MSRVEPLSRAEEGGEHRLRLAPHPEAAEPRAIVIRQGGGWQSLAFLLLCLLLIVAVLLGQGARRGLDAQDQQLASSLARAERRIQRLEAGIAFDARRRQLLLGMRDQILRVNPRVALADAYLYARLALEASEKYPSVDPLLLLAIGTVESGFEARARSGAGARGLYQIWPSTGRLLARSLGWDYDDETLYDPEKNTEAAALYLDVLFAAYGDPRMVVAEYNGGPVNAGHYRAEAGALAPETRQYVPRVLDVYTRLQEEFGSGEALPTGPPSREPGREGRALGAVTAGHSGREPDPPAP